MHPNNHSIPHHHRPQNISCPAGGTNGSDHGQRGVIVAPPSGNTWTPEPYQVLHKGFDTVALSIRANIPLEFFEHLETHKAIAEAEGQDILIDWNGVKLLLKGHGGMGYRFSASGGPFGANWAFKKPNAKDPWGIRVTFGSTFLATFGLGAARSHLDRELSKLCIRTKLDDISMSRVDYCVDILAPEFALDPDAFVMHSSTNRRDYVAKHDDVVNGKSGRVTSVTIGSTRARQVIVYDKRLEVIQKQKSHWWEIWNKTRAKAGLPELNPKHRYQKVWRIEFRAGKDLLKDVWNIRTWADLFARFGDLCAQTGNVIRYTEPVQSDKNRARWPVHPLWEIACAEIVSDLFEMREGQDPNPIKTVIREQHISTLIKNIFGSTVTLAALEGTEADCLPSYLQTIGRRLARQAEADPKHTEKHLKRATERYHFVLPNSGNVTK